MKQFSITEQKIKIMLEQAFIAGYESPLEMMDEEIASIYNNSLLDIKEAGSLNIKTNSCEPNHPPVIFDTDQIYKDAKRWLFGTDD